MGDSRGLCGMHVVVGHLCCSCLRHPHEVTNPNLCLFVWLQFCDVIRGYPLVPSPEIFGLHENADITCQQAETYALLGTLLGLQPRSSSGGGGAGSSQEAVVGRMAQDILDKVSALFGNTCCSMHCFAAAAGCDCLDFLGDTHQLCPSRPAGRFHLAAEHC